MSASFAIAQEDQIPLIVELANKSHRPPGGKGAGWTQESHLVAGNRIEDYHLHHLMHNNNSAVLVMLVDGALVGAVYVTADAVKAHIGMLSIEPELQNKGYGSQLLSYAEQFAIREFDVPQVVMLLVSDRPEVLSFFERRGYLFTQQTMPFPIDAGVGIPKSDSLELLLLAKTFPTDILAQSKGAS